jgi:hypothetical protein
MNRFSSEADDSMLIEKAKLAALTDDYADLNLIVGSQTDELSSLRANHNQIRNEYDDLSVESNSLRSDVAQLKTDVLGLKTENIELKTENFELKKDNIELKKDNIELKKDNIGLKASVLTLENVLENSICQQRKARDAQLFRQLIFAYQMYLCIHFNVAKAGTKRAHLSTSTHKYISAELKKVNKWDAFNIQIENEFKGLYGIEAPDTNTIDKALAEIRQIETMSSHPYKIFDKSMKETYPTFGDLNRIIEEVEVSDEDLRHAARAALRSILKMTGNVDADPSAQTDILKTLN